MIQRRRCFALLRHPSGQSRVNTKDWFSLSISSHLIGSSQEDWLLLEPERSSGRWTMSRWNEETAVFLEETSLWHRRAGPAGSSESRPTRVSLYQHDREPSLRGWGTLWDPLLVFAPRCWLNVWDCPIPSEGCRRSKTPVSYQNESSCIN